jgi:ubiquinone/menaquinone biosynthesis C-methylase UbiE
MATTSDPHGHHDWHSADYVEQWITTDVTNDESRRPQLRRMAELLPADRDITVLDIGGGYGVVSREVLDARPRARIVFHDFSEPMFEHARERLADALDRVTFVQADLRDPGWVEKVGGPFDGVVSSLAIHNVRDAGRIKAVYGEVFSLVAPGGCFLNVDSVAAEGGADAPSLSNQLRWLEEAGFETVDCPENAGRMVLLTAFRAK